MFIAFSRFVGTKIHYFGYHATDPSLSRLRATHTFDHDLFCEEPCGATPLQHWATFFGRTPWHFPFDLQVYRGGREGLPITPPTHAEFRSARETTFHPIKRTLIALPSSFPPLQIKERDGNRGSLSPLCPCLFYFHTFHLSETLFHNSRPPLHKKPPLSHLSSYPLSRPGSLLPFSLTIYTESLTHLSPLTLLFK